MAVLGMAITDQTRLISPSRERTDTSVKPLQSCFIMFRDGFVNIYADNRSLQIAQRIGSAR